MDRETGVIFHEDGSISFIPHLLCYYYSCANCSYRKGTLCLYKKEE